MASVLPETAIEPLRSKLLKRLPFVRHGVTRRVTGLGPADGNISYSGPRDIAEAWQMRKIWSSAIGIDPSSLVTAHQVHGSDVRVVTRSDAGTGSAPRTGLIGRVDALVTAESNVSMMMTHADCLPILLCDPRSRIVGVVHAGWRGTVQNVAARTIQAMTDQFGSLPEEIIAFLGPAICQSCYQVGDEVAAQWTASFGPESRRALDRNRQGWHFDISAANAMQLTSAGLRPESIERSGICTCCGGPSWFSHRGQGTRTGRFGAIIALID